MEALGVSGRWALLEGTETACALECPNELQALGVLRLG
jgi:hypothetical protein